MNIEETLKVMRSLANASNPETGDALEETHVCRQPLFVKAVNRAISSLVQEQQREQQKPAKAFHSWTTGEIAQVCEEIRQGMDFHEIAKKHNRSTASIIARLVKLGKITAGQAELPLSVPQTSLVQGANTPNQQPPTANSDRPWSIEEDKQVSEEFHQAVDFEEIAAIHGRTRRAVVSRLVKLGEIKRPSPAAA